MAEDALFDGIFEEIDKGDFKPGVPTAQDNPLLLDAIDEVVADKRLPQAASAIKAKTANPDAYQALSELSTKTGFDVPFVERNRQLLEEQVKAGEVADIYKANPALGEWFASGDNADAVKVDELRQLSGLSWLGNAALDAAVTGAEQTQFGTLSTKVMRGVATPEELAQADKLFNGLQPRSYGADGWLEGAWVETFKQLPQLYGYATSSITGAIMGFGGGAVTGGTGALIAGQLGPQAAAPEELVTVPAAALAVGSATAKAGAVAAAYLYSFDQIAGPAFYEYKNITDENGQKLDPDVARVAAYITGSIGGGLEFIGSEKLVSMVPGADKITGIFTKDFMRQALTQPTIRQAFKNFAKNTGEGFATEVGTEVAQQAVQLFTQEVAKQFANSAQGGSFTAMSADDIATSLLDTATQTAQAMTIIAPAMSGTRLGHDFQRAQSASRDAAILEAVDAHAKGNELNTRLPEKSQAAVAAMIADGPVKSVYLSPEAFTTLFQSVDEVGQFVDTLGIRAEYEEASRLGRDIEIPFEVYYTKIAGTDIGEALRPMRKLAPDSMTPLEADAFNEAWQEAQATLRSEYEATQAADKTELAGEEVVFDDVKNRALDAGIVPDQAQQYAKLYSTFFRVMGARTGQDPNDIYQQYGFDIKRALPGDAVYKPIDSLDISLGAIRSGSIPRLRKEVEKAKGPSLVAAIKERGGIDDTGGELAAMNVPRGVSRGKTFDSSDWVGGKSTVNENSADDMVARLWEDGYFPEFQDRPTPNDLYAAIGEELGGEPRYSVTRSSANLDENMQKAELVQFADMLDEQGLDPNTMTDDEIRAALDAVTNSDADTNALYQEKGVKRGSIQLAPGRTVVNLFDQADLSTFLHESGHFFLEVFKDLATAQNVDPAIAVDWQIAKEQFGIGDDGAIPVEAHEKFARSFETYLFEGNAPSDEVAGIFGRFRSWLVFVYKSAARLNAPINEKIRGVMDRLLATDEEIVKVKAAPEFRPAFKNAADAGMTEAQWSDYMAAAAKAVDKARIELDTRMLQDIARESTREWKEAKREIREEVQQSLSREPVYQALSYLRTGEWTLTDENGLPVDPPAERLSLSRDDVIAVMGEGSLQRLPGGVPPIYRASGGVHPDIVADLFGFKSGHELLTRLMSVPSMGRAVNEEVNIRMKARFGDLMGDAVARAREAQAAITNDDTGELLAVELGVLVRKGLVTSTIRKQDAQRIAARIIREKPIREAVRERLYANANSKAAAEAESAIIKQDWKKAVAAKQRQLLNHYMALESRNAQREVESAVNYLNRFTGRKRVANVDPEYLAQIETLLERFDLRKSVTLRNEQRRASLAAWIAEQEEQGALIQIPEALRDDTLRKPYRQLSVDDLMAVRDTVKNIEHLGKLKSKLLANKAQREFNAARDEIIRAVSISQPERKTAKTRNPTDGDKVLSIMRSMDTSLLKMEQVFDWMDSGDVNGPLNRMIFQPIARAEARENDLQLKYSGKFLEILRPLDKDRLAEWITVPGISQTMQRSEIMAVALNTGNQGNYDRMVKGDTWTDADVKRITDNLNAEEWAAVQSIWDTINELWPEIAKLQKRLTGVEPPKVEPRSVETPHGVLTGGYYPIIYDPERSALVRDREAANADRLFENTYLKPETWHGFTKERASSVPPRPLLFKLDEAGNHLINVIHDLTHREAIIDANKLLTNPDVRATIEARYSKELYDQFVPWLQSIAHDRQVNDGLKGINAVFRGIRSRATIMGMGFRISTIITQIAGISPALEMVPAKRLAGAMKSAALNWNESSRLVNELSGEMRHRVANLDRDIRDQIRQQTGKKGRLDSIRKFAFYGIGYMDRAIAVPTWLAAYNDHIARVPTDKAGAIAHADKVIRLTQGAGGAKDLAAIMRKNEGVKLFTMFYSYFNAYYNRQRAWGRDAKKAIANKEYRDFPQLLARQVFMTVGPAILAELLVGKGPEKDEDYATWMAKKIALYPFMAVPVLRDGVNALTSGFGYDSSPAGRTVSETVVDPFQALGKLWEGELTAREATKQTIETTGYALKLPLGQVATSVNNVWKAIEKDDFRIRDLVLTRPKE